ncbi:MAG: sulfatase-like hydrolase/transferase [Candidatus Latescibacterota bacterium]|nr:sulfatase-like hydrolase/transferase [Candidatus Latescibacterota bacterium]
MPDQPNILLFISDQQRTDTMSCYGNDWIQSPHQNALADRSFVFDNAYVTQAVCTPSRGSLITGLHPHTHGCVINRTKLDDSIPTIAEMLPDTYRKAHFGKWHLGDDTLKQHGFDEWISTEDNHRANYSRDLPFTDYYHWMKEQGYEPKGKLPNGDVIFSAKQRYEFGPECQMAAFVADHSERFIRENVDQPWLLVFSTFEPHPPMTGPYNDMYDPDELPVGPGFLKHPDGHSYFDRARAQHYPRVTVDGEELSGEAGWRKLRAQYFGLVKIIDDAVGRLVRTLEDTGQFDNTVFAFTSDHGEMAGDHYMLEKRAFYEESARIPLVLSAPWLTKKQKRVEGVFSHVDLVPTLLDIAGQSVPDSVEGTSQAAALESGNLGEHAAVIEWDGMGDRNLGNPTINTLASLQWRSIVTADRWKLNLCAGDQCELFDLNSDPYELTNLYNVPEHQDRIRMMAAEIRIWQHRTGDVAPLPAV